MLFCTLYQLSRPFMESSVCLEKTESVREKHLLPSVFLMANSLETGGTERQFATLAQALDDNLFSLSMGCLKREGAFLRGLNGIKEFAPGGSLFKWRSLRARLALARHLRRSQVSVAHSFDFYSNLMLIPAARAARVPVVVGSQRQLGDLLPPAKRHAQNLMFRLCHRVVCNSEAAAERLRASGLPKRKLVVIPNAVADKFFVLTPPALPRDPNTFNVGMISRMNDRYKRHDRFLQAAARLSPRFPQARFILVGDGPLRGELEALAQSLGLKDKTLFLGERSDMPAVLASLDLNVLPSESESLSNVILESMAAGVPTVATRVGGNAELIEHGLTGLLAGTNDPDQMSAALELFLTQPDMRGACGARARERAMASYGIRKIVQRYQDLYRELLNEKSWCPSAHKAQT
jgi:glycosyltransferase involved in cell wall biosynthesis